MTIWLDAHLSPRLARWIAERFNLDAVPLRDLGLRDASDEKICLAARSSGVVVITKDADFLKLLDRFGSPPQVIWLTCGNTSEDALKALLLLHLDQALELLQRGERLVEIGGNSRH
jgi:predicted nuclease of predicted toxin-antitoxin system